MLRFLDPAFLFGLLAIGVPIALHLLFRRRVPVLDFPLMRLIARAERSRQPRKRLNRVLLLVARSLALALLSLALARTMLGPGRVVASTGPVAAVFVLDDSLSMRALAEDGRSAHEHGLDEALELLRLLPEGSSTAVLLASDPAPGEAAGLASEPAAARADLERWAPGARHVRLGPALAAAQRLLALAPVADRRVVLVSDLARHAFEDLSLQPAEGEAPVLELVVPPPPAGVNRSVTGLEAEPLPDGRLGVTARVAGWGGAAPEVAGELRIGRVGEERRLAGRAVLSPGGGAAAERRFHVAPPGDGYGLVAFRIEPDALADDDRREAACFLSRRPRVLVVDGDPQNLSFGSETFYLERALAPGVGLDFETEFVTVPELRPDDFRRHDVVLLCNVPELSEERSLALTEAVRGGLGLIVSLGDRVSQPVYNGRLAEALPATLGAPVERRQGSGVEALDQGIDLPRVSVRTSFSLVADADARTSARLEDGAPLLVEGRLGEGRVLLLATTLDRDWTDLPISPHFLPLLHELIGRVASRRLGVVLPPVGVGAVVDLSGLSLPPGARVRDPEGTLRPVAYEGRFSATETPGVHLVEVGGEPAAAFSVVTDPAESDLARHSRAELAGLLGAALRVDAASEGDAAPGGGRPLWSWLLGLLVLVTGAESWLARRAA
jgi:hypothetical protein